MMFWFVADPTVDLTAYGPNAMPPGVTRYEGLSIGETWRALVDLSAAHGALRIGCHPAGYVDPWGSPVYILTPGLDKP